MSSIPQMLSEWSIDLRVFAASKNCITWLCSSHNAISPSAAADTIVGREHLFSLSLSLSLTFHIEWIFSVIIDQQYWVEQKKLR